MKTKNIFKTVALAMMMPAMMLTTACSNEDDAINNGDNKKGYPLQVTVNVTRQGDKATTRATYNDGTKTLAFSTGDKLFVGGINSSVGGPGRFAGTLTWQSGGTFSGTIYTQNEWTGTADALFTDASASGIVNAFLMPNGYESYNFLSINNNGSDDLYDDGVAYSFPTAFVASETAKATGVEQLSFEQATTYSSGFALAPANAILNFTISGLEAGAQDVTLSIDHGGLEYPVTGSVTPNASGVATFAIGVPVGANIKDKNMDTNLTVGTHNFTLPSSTTFTAGKIYNITRNAIPDLLSGVFSVSGSKKVKFSKGNLRYSSGTWSFFNNQYDYYTSYSADAWDHFGWSTSATTYGMSTSETSSTYSGSFVDWGSNSDLQTALGTGWFTLSSSESTYLFNTRSASTVGGTSNGRYAKANVNGVWGVILFPDTYTHPDGVTAPTGVNAGGDTGNGNNYSSADWTKMESAGCVFLPAAGYRMGSSVISAGIFGAYWSATSSGKASDYSAYDFVYYYSGYLAPAFTNTRNHGFSVRLVRQVTE